MTNSIKNNFTETGISRVANKITEVLEDSGFQTDKDLVRHILLMLVIGSYKVRAVTRDLTNEQVGEIIINELIYFHRYSKIRYDGLKMKSVLASYLLFWECIDVELVRRFATPMLMVMVKAMSNWLRREESCSNST